MENSCKNEKKSGDNLVFALVNNIPKNFRSKNLRAFFSTFVEEKFFDCFHFRHRPEKKSTKNDAGTSETSEKSEICCCLVRLTAKNRENFIKKYSGQHWTDENGRIFGNLKCFITPVKSPEENDLLELNPPNLMPQGNVGTPSDYFLELIKSCRLPANLIGKLGLTFSKSFNGRRTYGRVPLDYGETKKTAENSTNIEEKIAKIQNPPDPDDAEGADDDRCQEFERHEANYDDVTDQERTKERLYEEEMEIVWEKGGPGLVFYTDAFYWDQEKGTDTDERWADDWGVDSQIYYPDPAAPSSSGAGDKDSADMMDMRRWTLFKEGKSDESVFKKRKSVGISRKSGEITSKSEEFFDEKYSKGVARRVMERQGWRRGTGLGREGAGQIIPAAVEMESESQSPGSKKGLGYRGEKLQRFNLTKKPEKRLISTKYDDKNAADPPEQLLRRSETTQNKWR